jgi:hypothetical protein
MATIQPNTTATTGVVAVFQYPKAKHVAVVVLVEPDRSFWILECNYHSGECGVRKIPSDYPRLRGFYR